MSYSRDDVVQIASSNSAETTSLYQSIIALRHHELNEKDDTR